MTTPTHPGRSLFVTLPVADRDRSVAFFSRLGFPFDERFEAEGSACMLVGEHATVMLLDRPTFAQYSHRPVADPATHALALLTFTVESRGEVDAVAQAALAAGGDEADGPEDQGCMYTRSFFDLDGHGWQVMWMDPVAMAQASAPGEATAAPA